MARFFTLSSGSNGNSSFIGDSKSGILIDVGISFLRVNKGLNEYGINIENIEALLITHEHSDHIKGLETFCKKTDIPVFATQKTAERILSEIPNAEKNIHIIEKCKKYTTERFEFSAFSVYHDAADTVGYEITTPDNRKVAYSTDIGHIDEEICAHLQNADLNVIEANYDEGMLMCNVAYPFLLKKRISGECGHLSNKDCAQFVLSLAEKGAKRFVLAHLSEQNNTPQVAFEAVKLSLTNSGREIDKDYELFVAPRNENSRMLIF